MSNIKSICQQVRGLRLPNIRGFPFNLNDALTTVLRTNVLHCDKPSFGRSETNFADMATLANLLVNLHDAVKLADPGSKSYDSLARYRSCDSEEF